MHGYFGLDRFTTTAFGRHVLNIGDAEVESSFEA